MKALRFVQALALVPAWVPACTAPPPREPAPSSVSPSVVPTTAGSLVAEPPTAGDGPCRCSWETNAAAAPRVCRKGEVSHAGKACVVNAPKSYPVEGPLAPPTLDALDGTRCPSER